MASKSNSCSEISFLPRGDRSLKGIDEKFSPDLYTGAGNFTVPIAFFPDGNGFRAKEKSYFTCSVAVRTVRGRLANQEDGC